MRDNLTNLGVNQNVAKVRSVYDTKARANAVHPQGATHNAISSVLAAKKAGDKLAQKAKAPKANGAPKGNKRYQDDDEDEEMYDLADENVGRFG